MVELENAMDKTWQKFQNFKNGKVEPLPEMMVSQELYSDNEIKFTLAWEKVVEAYTKLRHLNQCADAIPHNPKEITLERLTAYVENMKDGANEQTVKYYDGILWGAQKDIKTIREFFECYPSAEVDVDDTTMFFERAIKCKNKADVVEALSLVDIHAVDGITTMKISYGPNFEHLIEKTEIRHGKAGKKIDLGINNLDNNL